MARLGMACLVAACLFVPSPSPAALATPNPKPGEELYRAVVPSVVTLYAMKSDGGVVTGTGFLGIRDGVVITAWHVVRDAKRVKAKFQDGEEFESSGVLDKDEARDVALIKLKVFGRPLLSLDGTSPEVGTRAYAIGAPIGFEFTISDGLISQRQIVDGQEQLQFTCAVSPGNSGGPLLDENGKVRGVVSWQVRNGQNLNFAVPAKYVLGLDASLPTQPWGAVASSPEFPQADSVASADAEEALTRALMIQIDAVAAIYSASNQVVFTPGGYLMGVPSYLYAKEQEVKEVVAQISTARGKTNELEAARKLSLRRLENILTSMELESEGIRKAGSAGGWTPAATDLINRSESYLGVPKWEAAEARAIKSSSRVREALSRDALEYWGLSDSSRTVSLGLSCWASKPMWIWRVSPGSVADQMGLRVGDQIVTVNGKAFDSLGSIRDHFASTQGTRYEMLVTRRGQTLKLKGKVPTMSAGAVINSQPPNDRSAKLAADVPLRITLVSNEVLLANSAEPWPGEMIKVTLTGGEIRYISAVKIRSAIVNGQVDAVKTLVQERKRVP